MVPNNITLHITARTNSNSSPFVFVGDSLDSNSKRAAFRKAGGASAIVDTSNDDIYNVSIADINRYARSSEVEIWLLMQYQGMPYRVPSTFNQLDYLLKNTNISNGVIVNEVFKFIRIFGKPDLILVSTNSPEYKEAALKTSSKYSTSNLEEGGIYSTVSGVFLYLGKGSFEPLWGDPVGAKKPVYIRLPLNYVTDPQEVMSPKFSIVSSALDSGRLIYYIRLLNTSTKPKYLSHWRTLGTLELEKQFSDFREELYKLYVQQKAQRSSPYYNKDIFSLITNTIKSATAQYQR